MNRYNQKTEQPSPERLISIQELEALTGMKRSTLYLWSEIGKIPCIHAGKSLRYRFSDVLKALEGRHE